MRLGLTICILFLLYVSLTTVIHASSTVSFLVQVDINTEALQLQASKYGLTARALPLPGWYEITPSHPLRKSSFHKVHYWQRRLRGVKGVISVSLQKERRVSLREPVSFNDPLWTNGAMWYWEKGEGMGVQEVWEKGLTGKGVNITILDDGLDFRNEEFEEKFLKEWSFDYTRGTSDARPAYGQTHGTKVAGVAAGSLGNGFCGGGAAPEANVIGVRLISYHGGTTHSNEVRSLLDRHKISDIFVVSWGAIDDGKTVDRPAEITHQALQKAATEGRGGKGSLIVVAAGNGGDNGDDCSCDGYASGEYVVAVQAMNKNGSAPYYTEKCAAAMTSVYVGAGLAAPLPIAFSPACSLGFAGTSAAAPSAAGMVALLLQQYPELTRRDVLHLIVNASSPVESGSPERTTVASSTGVPDKTTVSSSTGVPDKTTVSSSTGVPDKTTVSSSTGVPDKTIVSSSTGETEKRPVSSSTGVPDKTTTFISRFSSSQADSTYYSSFPASTVPGSTPSGNSVTTASASTPPVPNVYENFNGNGDWITNAAGHKFHPRFGFGLLNAARLVELAKNWDRENVSNYQICNISSKVKNELHQRLVVDTDSCVIVKTERVTLTLEATSTSRGSIEITITSPQETRIKLLHRRKRDTGKGSFKSWSFSTPAFWNEDPIGEWIVNITGENVSATLESLTFSGAGLPIPTTTPLPTTTPVTSSSTVAPTPSPSSSQPPASTTMVLASSETLTVSPQSYPTPTNTSSTTPDVKTIQTADVRKTTHVSFSVTPAPTQSATTIAQNVTTTDAGESGNNLPYAASNQIGRKVGIGLGCLFAGGIVGAAVVFLWKRRQRKGRTEKSTDEIEGVYNEMGPFNDGTDGKRQ